MATTKRRYCYPIEKVEFGQAPFDKQLFHALPVLCLNRLIPNFSAVNIRDVVVDSYLNYV